MIPFVFIFSLFLVFQQPQPWPQSNPFTDSTRDEWRHSYAKFKPGPRVLAELEKLKLREREADNAWSDSEYTLRELNLERNRIAIHRHLLLCMALMAGERDHVPELIIVLAHTREIMKVFPSGKLPADPLQPNTVYQTGPGSSRRVRYLTMYQWGSGGPKFAVFAREVQP